MSMLDGAAGGGMGGGGGTARVGAWTGVTTGDGSGVSS